MKYPPVLESVDGERVAGELAPLLYSVYRIIQESVTDLPAIHEAIRELLQFLSTGRGRTNANCSAADSFFLDIDNNWAKSWGDLPEAYQDLLGDMGGCLHDTISAPNIAENFDSTPEQLLVRLERLRSGPQPA